MPILPPLALPPPPAATLPPPAPLTEALNTRRFQDRYDACAEYLEPSAEGDALTDDEIFKKYFIEREQCEVATFLISPDEMQKLHDMLASMVAEHRRWTAAYWDVRARYQDLFSVLEQLRTINTAPE